MIKLIKLINKVKVILYKMKDDDKTFYSEPLIDILDDIIKEYKYDDCFYLRLRLKTFNKYGNVNSL